MNCGFPSASFLYLLIRRYGYGNGSYYYLKTTPGKNEEIPETEAGGTASGMRSYICTSREGKEN